MDGRPGEKHVTAFSVKGHCPLIIDCVVPTSAKRPAPIIVETIARAINTRFNNIHSSEYTVSDMTYQADSINSAGLPAGSQRYTLHYSATVTFANPACATYFALTKEPA